jgi:predicted nucleotidyltransferase
MPPLDMPPAWMHLLSAILRRHVPDAVVWAYGSRVSGGAQVCSDLDLVVRDPADPARPVPRVAALREALRDSQMPIAVDVHDWSALPADFRRDIERCHHVVQAPGVGLRERPSS